MSGDGDDSKGPKPVKDLLPRKLKLPGAVIQRTFQDSFLASAGADADSTTVFQHSVLCQTCLPFRDPGDEVRIWSRRNGRVHLEIQAGRAFDGSREEFIDVGLPFGPKPRLVLYHLNAEALRTRSPLIELEDSLTAFVKRTLGLDTGGRNIRTVKDQLTRLSATDFRIGAMTGEGRATTLKGTVIQGFDMWVPRDAHQRTLWPSTVRFSHGYFESLMQHAVPLNERAVAGLSHTAMGLDIYTWLAQRLHRVERNQGVFIPWTALHDQFGQGYERLRDFRRTYNRTLKQVTVVYPEAKFDLDEGGMRLWHSRPPVARRL